MTDTKFVDLPERAFPLTLEIFEIGQDIHRAMPIWRAVVNGPGVVRVPAFGRQMRTRVRYGDGAETVQPPLPEELWI